MVSQAARTDIGVTTLGGFSVAWGGRALPASEWSRKRAAALFRALIGAPGFRLTADTVVERLWPESTALAGRTNLRVKIFEVRAIMARHAPPEVDPAVAPPVTFEGGVVAIDPQYGPQIDALNFERAGLAALEGDDDAAVTRAFEAYTGPYLPEERDDAVLVLRERFARVHRALGLRAAASLVANPERVERLLEPMFAAYPYDEELALALASARAALGHRVDLRDMYLAHERALGARSGLLPSPRFASLAGMRNGSSAVTGEHANASSSHAKNGNGSANVSARSERDDAVTGGPQSVSARASAPLIGRTREVATVARLLDAIADGGVRRIAVVGSAGSGKSRFAREIETLARERGCAVAFARAFRDVPLDLLVDELLDSLGAGIDVVPALDDGLGALETALVAQRAERATIAIVDDANCAPQALLTMLSSFSQRHGERGFAVVECARERGSECDRDLDGDIATIELDALDAASVRAIVAASFDAPVDAALVDLLATLWAGDLGLALASAAHARANGTAVRTPAGWCLRAGGEIFDAIPERNRLSIVRRILALDPRAVEAVKALAFAGDGATRETVELLTSRDAAEIAHAFDRIAESALGERVRESIALPVAVRAVAGELLSRRRRALFVERLATGIAKTFR